MTSDKHQDSLSGEEDVTGLLAQDEHARPRAELDAVILASAKQAVADKSTGTTSHSSKWAVPVSLAATIVLSVSIVMLMQSPPPPEPELELEPESELEQILPRAVISPAASDIPRKPAAPPPARREARQGDADLLRKRSLLDQEAKQDKPLASAAVAEEVTEADKRKTAAGLAGLPQITEPPLKPEAWLEKIGVLLEQEQREKARDELVHLHQTYPDFRSETMLTLARQLKVELSDRE